MRSIFAESEKKPKTKQSLNYTSIQNNPVDFSILTYERGSCFFFVSIDSMIIFHCKYYLLLHTY